MTRDESKVLAELMVKVAVLETQTAASIKQNAVMEKTQKEMKETIDRIDKALSSGKAFRLGILAALPISGGGVGAALMNWLKSGGPTGTH